MNDDQIMVCRICGKTHERGFGGYKHDSDGKIYCNEHVPNRGDYVPVLVKATGRTVNMYADQREADLLIKDTWVTVTPHPGDEFDQSHPEVLEFRRVMIAPNRHRYWVEVKRETVDQPFVFTATQQMPSYRSVQAAVDRAAQMYEERDDPRYAY